MPGATKGVLSIPSAWSPDAGTYLVAVNNSVGPVTNSQAVTLTVTPPPTLAKERADAGTAQREQRPEPRTDLAGRHADAVHERQGALHER